MMTRLLAKEVCGCCQKNISLGQAVTECEKCTCVIHTKCFKKSFFQVINNRNYCCNCKDSIEHVYNPFELLCRSNSQNDYSDRPYNAELSDCFEEFSAISDILSYCTRYKTIEDFNNSINQNISLTDMNLSLQFQENNKIFKKTIKFIFYYLNIYKINNNKLN